MGVSKKKAPHLHQRRHQFPVGEGYIYLVLRQKLLYQLPSELVQADVEIRQDQNSHLIFSAGTPTYVPLSVMLLITTAPAPIIQLPQI